MNYLKIEIVALLIFWQQFAIGQTAKLKITPQINLPKDSVTKASLIRSLDFFLQDINGNLGKSKFVDNKHYKEYVDFFDALKGIERSKRYNDTAFFTCYLKNVILLPNNDYKIQLSYYGVTKENEVINRLNISLIAKKNNDLFFFYCPFRENTQLWKNQKIENIDFYYESTLDKQVALDFNDYNNKLAKKLKLKPLQFKYYKCKNIQQVYSLMGIDYDIAINGDVRSGSFDIVNSRFLSGTNTDQYKHDLTHAYFSLKYADSLKNWTAEEGYNIYATDYWGESSQKIIEYLKEYIKANPQNSLIKAFEANVYLKHPIPIKYPLAAILVKKIERELGFDKVLELIACGESDDHFFEKLKQLISVTKDNFDKVIKEELLHQ